MSKSRQRRILIYVTVLAVIVPLSLAWRMARGRHVPIVFSHYFAGRAGTCDLKHSFEGESISTVQRGNFEALAAASRVTQSDGAYQKWTTPAGDYWMPTASGDALLYDLAEQKRDIYGKRLRPGDVVLDCGANVGVFVRKALDAGASKIVAIEPAPENLECLRRNFSREIASGAVLIYPKGVWDKEDTLKMSIDPKNSAGDSFVRTAKDAQFISLPLTTIDKLVAELNLPRVDFIKMDIEGAEQHAITGAKETISRFHPRMSLCIYHLEQDQIAIPRMVQDIVPAYQFDQSCLLTSDRVQPEVAFFY
jgi:FkbM family methyltransferase